MFYHLVTNWTVSLNIYITNNRLDIVGITEAWLANVDKNNV